MKQKPKKKKVKEKTSTIKMKKRVETLRESEIDEMSELCAPALLWTLSFLFCQLSLKSLLESSCVLNFCLSLFCSCDKSTEKNKKSTITNQKTQENKQTAQTQLSTTLSCVTSQTTLSTNQITPKRKQTLTNKNNVVTSTTTINNEKS
jgi:hypothetical protein